MKFLKVIFPILLFFFSVQVNAQMEIDLEEIASGFSNIVKIANAGDDRLFIVERSGRIKIIDGSGTTLATPFLDIDSKVIFTGGFSEQGLLGLAFHPNYANNGYFYVHYSDNSGNTQISRFSVSTTDPNLADVNSELSILSINQPFVNHNGGEIEFGPDGYMYIGMGDGGSSNDPGNRSQNPQTLIGKMLRIDISQEPYAIPADNPFVNDPNVLDEIWALGLRNPWRFSFDAMTGDLWIGDVGQWAIEEIDFQPANSTGGENYGWRCREGSIENSNVNTTNCLPVSSLVEPIWEYAHGSDFKSVTGGFVYRNCLYPELHGRYLFAEYVTGEIWGLTRDANGVVENEELKVVSNGSWTTFGQDNEGELYIAGLNNGRVYHIALGDPVTEVEINNDLGLLSVADDFESYQWFFDGSPIANATDATHAALESGNYTVEVVHPRGCSYGSNTMTVIITSTPEIKGMTNFSMQPNPFQDELSFNLSLAEAQSLQLKVYSLDGKVVYERSLKKNLQWSEKIDLSELKSAVYLLRISSEEGELVRRIIKE